MPIGPITPGSYVNIYADPDPQTVVLNTTITPTATMLVTAADFQVFVLGALNNFAALSEPARVSTTQYPLAARADNRVALRTPTHDGHWTYVNGTIALQANDTSPRNVTQIIPIPKGNALTEIDVWLSPQSGHSFLPGPGGEPAITLRRWDPTTGLFTDLATKVDSRATSGSIPNYEAVHTVRFTISDFPGGVAIVPDMTKIYGLWLQSESGGSAIAGMQYNGCEVSYTMTKVDPAS